MKARLTLSLLAMISAGGWSVRAQQQPATGSIHGAVVDAGTNDPLPGARVTAESTNRVAIVTTTNAAGEFAFTNLDPGPYELTFAARGYVQQRYGQKSTGGAGMPAEILAGQVVRGLVTRLTPTGSVEGRILDSNGNPAAGAPVELMRSTYDFDGKKTFTPVAVVDTDDRGMYRIFWITPGRYYLRAGGRIRISSAFNAVNGRAQDGVQSREPFAEIFYPNGVSPEFAVPIDVRAGADLHGMDFRLERQPFLRIRGRVIDAGTGRFPANANLGISGNGFSSSGGDRYNRTDGTFEIPDLVPGSYRIVAVAWEQRQTASQTPSGRQPMPASDFMTVQLVDKDLVDVVLRLVPPVPLTGSVLSDDGAALPQGLTVRLEAVEGRFSNNPLPNQLSGVVNADGAFTIPQIISGDYVVLVSDPRYYVKESRYGGSDVLNNPMKLVMSDSPASLDIKLSPRVAEVSGRITDNALKAAAGARVVLAPDRARHRRDLFRQAATDANGNYRFTNVWPGDYRLFAWESIEANSWHDPEVLKEFERNGQPVRVRESGSETADARLIPARP